MTAVRSWLCHPLLGIEERYTSIGLAYSGVVAILVLLSGWRRGLLAFSDLPSAVDGLSAAVIVLAGASVLAGIVYGLGNGGPALAATIPLSPQLAAGLVTGGFAADVDLALAVAGAGLAATLAVVRGELLGTDSPHLTEVAADGLTIAVVLTALGAITVVRIAGVVGPHATSGVVVAGAGVGCAVLGIVVVLAVLAGDIDIP